MAFFKHLETLLQQDGKSISEMLASLGTPFISMAIMEDGQISTRVSGSSKYNPETIFQAASISKPITALAVIKLAQQGRLDLDASISKYLNSTQLSWISTPKTKDLVQSITIRMLLSHTSGLAIGGFPGYPSDPPEISSILAGSPPSNTRAVTLDSFPGQRFSYSGGGITVIQLILETLLDKPFADIMEEIVLEPLKMTRSSYRFLDENEGNWAPASYTGYTNADPSFHYQPERAAAGLWSASTPNDLLLAVSAVQKSLDSGGFLEKKWAEEMLEEVDGGMGLGWAVKKGLPRFWHSGANNPGYRCMVLGSRDPKSLESSTLVENASMPVNAGICLMTSSAEGFILLEKVYTAICYLKGWQSGIGTFAFGGDSLGAPLIDPNKAVDARAKDWCGKWGDWIIQSDGDKGLKVQFKNSPMMDLFTAAIDPKSYEEGNSVDLVVYGLQIMLRLGWKEGKKVVGIWQDGKMAILEESI